MGDLRPIHFKGGDRSFEKSIRPNQMLMIDTFHLKTSNTSLLIGVAVDYASLYFQARLLQFHKLQQLYFIRCRTRKFRIITENFSIIRMHKSNIYTTHVMPKRHGGK